MIKGWVEIERDAFLDAIRVLDIIPQAAGIPCSDYVRLLVRDNHLEMALSSTVVGVVRVAGKFKGTKIANGDLFVDRRVLLPFVLMGQKWKGAFRMAFDQAALLVRQGSRSATFTVRSEPIQGYVNWVDRSAMKELRLSKELCDMLITSHRCAAADPSMPHLNCVYIGGRLVMSSNTATIFVGQGKADGMNFPFPVGIIPLLSNGLVEGVGIEGSHVILDCGCGYLEGSVSAVAKKDFPSKTIVTEISKAERWPLLAKLPARQLAAMLERLAQYLASVRREDWVLRLELENDAVKASVRIQQGLFKERIEVEDLKQSAVLEWPLEFVRPVLQYMADHDEEIKVRVDEAKKTPYLISGSNVKLMVARRA